MPPVTFAAAVWFLCMWIVVGFISRFVMAKYPDSTVGKALAVIN